MILTITNYTLLKNLYISNRFLLLQYLNFSLIELLIDFYALHVF